MKKISLSKATAVVQVLQETHLNHHSNVSFVSLARNENHQFMKERDLSAVRFVMLSQILQLKAVVEPDFNIKVFSKTS